MDISGYIDQYRGYWCPDPSCRQVMTIHIIEYAV